jgi:hypothetical protein
LFLLESLIIFVLIFNFASLLPSILQLLLLMFQPLILFYFTFHINIYFWFNFFFDFSLGSLIYFFFWVYNALIYKLLNMQLGNSIKLTPIVSYKINMIKPICLHSHKLRCTLVKFAYMLKLHIGNI